MLLIKWQECLFSLAPMNEDAALSVRLLSRLCEKECNVMLVIESDHVETVQLMFILCIQTNRMRFMLTR